LTQLKIKLLLIPILWLLGEFIVASVANRRRKLAQRPGGEFPNDLNEKLFNEDSVIHPYLGYIGIPGTPHHFSPLGFPGTASHIQQRTNGTLIVGIFGGSVAKAVSLISGETILARLKELISKSNFEIQIVSVAMGGYKQPQQLIALNYLLALGAEFDVVLNLDGFNEMALYPAENKYKCIAPIFPRNWFSKMLSLKDKEILNLIGCYYYKTEQKAKLKQDFEKAFLSFLPSYRLLHAMRTEALESEIASLAHRIRNYVPVDSRFAVSGPYSPFDDESSMYKQLTELWYRSSLQMHRLCQSNDILYLHCIQPNQYVPGTKVLNDDERQNAFDPEHPYKPGVERGYPLLLSSGKTLISEGVTFFDLTTIFNEERRTVYCDTCCHLTKLGNDLLAVKLAEAIASTWNIQT
jgi:hypothetical protein